MTKVALLLSYIGLPTVYFVLYCQKLGPPDSVVDQ